MKNLLLRQQRSSLFRSRFILNQARYFALGETNSKFKGVKIDNPYTREIIEKVPFINEEEQKIILKKCWESYRQYRYQPLNERKQIVSNIASYFRQNRELVATDITRMMGKPITQSREEVDYSCERIEALLGLADETLAPEIVQ